MAGVGGGIGSPFILFLILILLVLGFACLTCF